MDDIQNTTDKGKGALPWFRLYHRTVDDGKIRLLAFEDRWHFIALCCLKGAGILDTPPSSLRDREIAVKLGVQLRELEEIGRRLREVNLVDENLIPVAWDELQKPSDNSTERSRRHRQKLKQSSDIEECNGDATLQKRCSNGLDRDKEEEREEDKEPKGSCSSDDEPALKPEHIVEEWNKIAPCLGKPKVRDLTPERRQLLKARIGQYALDDFLTVLAAIERSKFLRGDTGWRGCTFDWIFKKANFQKILEGNYND